MIFPQMVALTHPCVRDISASMHVNANERKCYLGGYTKYSVVRQSMYVSSVNFVKNNINYSRSFAFICGK